MTPETMNSAAADRLRHAAAAGAAVHEPDAADLDAQILAAEAAVIERDERIAHALATLGRQTRASMPRRETMVLAACAGAVAVGALLYRRLRAANRSGRRGRARALRDDEQPQRVAAARLPWAGLVPLLWPLLPAHWRARVSPGTATALAGFIVTRLARRRGRVR